MAELCIYLDADSLPEKIRNIVFRACVKRRIPACVVSNRNLKLPKDAMIKPVKVGMEKEAADNYIIDCARVGNLVITRDIPLAAKLVEKGVVVINDRGGEFTEDNIRERLSIRNTFKELRELGIVEDIRTKTFSDKDVHAFAATFDKVLTRLEKEYKKQ
ncbi:DUF188 domain-containing protein [Spirochaetia bacterium 38H-sp]|uniref:UPF0178 protein WKV44_06300 n=1 Tax=Rarispira pelagica TaxID=3141764 RepID=A0ABU9UBW2_9SPIR